MNRRLALCVPLGMAAALALAGCASGTSGSPAANTGTSAPSSSVAPSSTAPARTTPAQLAAVLEHGLAGVSTARFTLSVDTSGLKIVGTGAEKLSDGKLTAAAITEQIGQASVQIRSVGGKAYLSLPASLRHGGKPWQLITARSSNPVVREIAGSFQQTLNSASVTSVGKELSAATSVTKIGTTSGSSGTLTQYRVLIDPQKLPSTSTFGKAAEQALGMKSIPLTIGIDSQGRVQKSVSSFTIQGRTVSIEYTVDSYNQPVTISAPPASQIGT